MKKVDTDVAFVTFLRPHTSTKSPAMEARASTYLENLDKGHDDPGPDRQAGIGTGALLICSLELIRGPCKHICIDYAPGYGQTVGSRYPFLDAGRSGAPRA